MKCDEIFAALALLEKERGIPQDFMMEKIVQALVTAYKRDHEDVENVVVDVNEEKRDLKMFVEKTVVEEVENPAAEISAEEAKAISAKYHVGDTVRFPVKNVDFGRIAAGNGKQVIIQGLREAEHGMIYDEYNSKQHEILTGTVVRVDPRTGNATVRLGTGADASDAVLLLGELKQALLPSPKSKLGALLGKDSLGDVKKLLDPSEVGGTPFLGISKPVLKAHGSSDARAIRNAVFRAVEYAQSGIIADVEAHIDVMKGEKNG